MLDAFLAIIGVLAIAASIAAKFITPSANTDAEEIDQERREDNVVPLQASKRRRPPRQDYNARTTRTPTISLASAAEKPLRSAERK